jgi:hypothetical protein
LLSKIQIQHKIAPCTGDDQSAQCNCGLAVRAGRDVYVINVCDNSLVIGLTHCGDEALTIKKENDFTYTVSFSFVLIMHFSLQKGIPNLPSPP